MKVTSVHSGRKSSENVLKASLLKLSFGTFVSAFNQIFLACFELHFAVATAKGKNFYLGCMMNEECSGCFSHIMHLVCNYLSIEVCR